MEMKTGLVVQAETSGMRICRSLGRILHSPWHWITLAYTSAYTSAYTLAVKCQVEHDTPPSGLQITTHKV